MLKYSVLLCFLVPQLAIAEALYFDCETKRDPGQVVGGDDRNFTIALDMDQRTMESGTTIYNDVVVSPTLVTAKSIKQSDVTDLIFYSTTQLSREDLSVVLITEMSSPGTSKMRTGSWSGICVKSAKKEPKVLF